MNHSFTEENYLKAIHKLAEEQKTAASTNSIAEAMRTKASSVTEMLKKLSKKKLISYEKYQGVTLTDKGEKIALDVIRKHRLWEVFLVEKLQFGWDEVHDIAEQLEHIRSEKLTDELDKLLGRPKTDPHGDPIPDKQGKLPLQESRPLSNCQLHKKYIMTGVANHSSEFLVYLDKNNIGLGANFSIVETIPFDHSLRVSINNGPPVFISHEVAKNLLVKDGD